MMMMMTPAKTPAGSCNGNWKATTEEKRNDIWALMEEEERRQSQDETSSSGATSSSTSSPNRFGSIFRKKIMMSPVRQSPSPTSTRKRRLVGRLSAKRRLRRKERHVPATSPRRVIAMMKGIFGGIQIDDYQEYRSEYNDQHSSVASVRGAMNDEQREENDDCRVLLLPRDDEQEEEESNFQQCERQLPSDEEDIHDTRNYSDLQQNSAKSIFPAMTQDFDVEDAKNSYDDNDESKSCEAEKHSAEEIDNDECDTSSSSASIYSCVLDYVSDSDDEIIHGIENNQDQSVETIDPQTITFSDDSDVESDTLEDILKEALLLDVSSDSEQEKDDGLIPPPETRRHPTAIHNAFSLLKGTFDTIEIIEDLPSDLEGDHNHNSSSGSSLSYLTAMRPQDFLSSSNHTSTSQTSSTMSSLYSSHDDAFSFAFFTNASSTRFEDDSVRTDTTENISEKSSSDLNDDADLQCVSRTPSHHDDWNPSPFIVPTSMLSDDVGEVEEDNVIMEDDYNILSPGSVQAANEKDAIECRMPEERHVYAESSIHADKTESMELLSSQRQINEGSINPDANYLRNLNAREQNQDIENRNNDALLDARDEAVDEREESTTFHEAHLPDETGFPPADQLHMETSPITNEDGSINVEHVAVESTQSFSREEQRESESEASHQDFVSEEMPDAQEEDTKDITSISIGNVDNNLHPPELNIDSNRVRADMVVKTTKGVDLMKSDPSSNNHIATYAITLPHPDANLEDASTASPERNETDVQAKKSKSVQAFANSTTETIVSNNSTPGNQMTPSNAANEQEEECSIAAVSLERNVADPSNEGSQSTSSSSSQTVLASNSSFGLNKNHIPEDSIALVERELQRRPNAVTVHVANQEDHVLEKSGIKNVQFNDESNVQPVTVWKGIVLAAESPEPQTKATKPPTTKVTDFDGDGDEDAIPEIVNSEIIVAAISSLSMDFYDKPLNSHSTSHEDVNELEDALAELSDKEKDALAGASRRYELLLTKRTAEIAVIARDVACKILEKERISLRDETVRAILQQQISHQKKQKEKQKGVKLTITDKEDIVENAVKVCKKTAQSFNECTGTGLNPLRETKQKSQKYQHKVRDFIGWVMIRPFVNAVASRDYDRVFSSLCIPEQDGNMSRYSSQSNASATSFIPRIIENLPFGGVRMEI